MAFDPRELRNVMGAFVTGVTVVTTVDAEGRPHGVTANSFSSVSLNPPLVLWSQATAARSHAVFHGAPRFAVNILALDQMQVSQDFARSDHDKFARTATRAGLGGVPLIEGSCAHLECRTVARHPGGDHTIFIGEVEALSRSECRPLVFGSGRYLVAFPHQAVEFSTAGPGAVGAPADAVGRASDALAEVAQRLDVTLGLGVWGNEGPTLVRWQAGPTPVAEDFRVGTVVSSIGSATGLAFAAFLPGALTDQAVAGEIASLSSTASLEARQAMVEARIAEVRAHGWARSLPHQFSSDIVAVSVPVRGADGHMLFALTAAAPSARFGADRALETALLHEANRLSPP